MDSKTLKIALDIVAELIKVKEENERLKNEIEFLRSLLKKEEKKECEIHKKWQPIVPTEEQWDYFINLFSDIKNKQTEKEKIIIPKTERVTLKDNGTFI
jgi:cell division septum initiation protein DivIVA